LIGSSPIRPANMSHLGHG